MRSWQCPNCARTHETEDDIKFVVCKGCLSSMKDVEELKKEVGDGNKGH